MKTIKRIVGKLEWDCDLLMFCNHKRGYCYVTGSDGKKYDGRKAVMEIKLVPKQRGK